MVQTALRYVKTGVIGLLFCLMAAVPVQANDRVTEAEQLVADLIAELEANTVSQMDDTDHSELLNRLVDTYFDVDGITRFSVGRYWRVATQTERDDYARLFRTVLVNQANAQFHQLKNLEFRPTTTKTKGDKLILVGGIIHDKSGEFPDVEIFWRIVALPDKPVKIFDVEVENISMLKTQQDENTTLIRRSGGRFAALNEALQERLSQQTSQ